MSAVWPSSTIRELIALAEQQGESRAKLDSAEEARLFRFAIYTFRRNNNLGYDFSITLEDDEVILRRKPNPPNIILGPNFASKGE